jgi:hypothetical protein
MAEQDMQSVGENGPQHVMSHVTICNTLPEDAGIGCRPSQGTVLVRFHAEAPPDSLLASSMIVSKVVLKLDPMVTHEGGNVPVGMEGLLKCRKRTPKHSGTTADLAFIKGYMTTGAANAQQSMRTGHTRN